MKKTPSLVKTPKRSVSMVSTMTRPIIEQKQYERAVSPTSSFSSSILARGMSETMTPQKMYHQSRPNPSQEQSNNLIPKTNRRRAIDFSRRRTVGGPAEQINNNKENVPMPRQQQTYQFAPSTSTNIATRKYFFHPNPSMKNEDLLMNSYGLTVLQQQQPQQPIRQRHSISSGVTMTSQAPDKSSIRSSQKPLSRRTSMNVKQPQQTLESLDDLLCDREVESYFYPNRRQQSPTSLPQHIYITLETTPNYYQLPPPP
jgi:hypothetical protein